MLDSLLFGFHVYIAVRKEILLLPLYLLLFFIITFLNCYRSFKTRNPIDNHIYHTWNGCGFHFFFTWFVIQRYIRFCAKSSTSMDNLYVGRFYSSDKSCDEILIGKYTLICFYGLLAPLAYVAGEGIGAAIVEDTYLSYGFII